MTPYKGTSAISQENTLFNLTFSAARVKIEHAIGQLKNRWCSLKCLRTQIRTVKDLKLINEWCLACCILHNMAIDQRDTWDDDYMDDNDGYQNEVELFVGHKAFRENLKRLIIQRNIQ
jgi:hypothetical protein